MFQLKLYTDYLYILANIWNIVPNSGTRQDKRFRSKALAKLGEENRLDKSGEKFNSAQAAGEVKGGGGGLFYIVWRFRRF